MLNLVSVILLSIALSSVQTQAYKDMSHEDIITESQLCGESNFFEEECLEKPNCVFIDWYRSSLEEVLKLCMSFNEIMKYYIKEPTRFLKQLGVRSHKTISKSNFCDIIEDDVTFYGENGNIKKCTMSTV